MSRRITRTAEVVPTAAPGFQPGHVRFGGRRKRTAQQARDLADQLGVDPLEYMLRLLAVDVIEEVEIDDKGKERRVKVPVGHELKLSISQSLAPFFYPRLTATQVTGKDEGPVRMATATLDVGKLLADETMAHAYQALAIAVCEMDADADGAVQPPTYSYELPPAQPTKP